VLALQQLRTRGFPYATVSRHAGANVRNESGFTVLLGRRLHPSGVEDPERKGPATRIVPRGDREPHGGHGLYDRQGPLRRVRPRDDERDAVPQGSVPGGRERRYRERGVRIQPRGRLHPEQAAPDSDRRRRSSKAGEKTHGSYEQPPVATPTTRDGLDQRREALEPNHPRMANGRRAGVSEKETAADEDRLRRVRHRGRVEAEPKGKPRGEAETRNAMNPRIGSGVQQTRKTRAGENRRGGEKPRRRNVTYPLARAGRSVDPRWSRPPENEAGVDGA